MLPELSQNFQHLASRDRFVRPLHCFMSTKADVLAITQRFAAALDNESYETLRSILAPDCGYEVRGETFIGHDAIIESYRHHGAIARRLFHAIEYRSELRKTGPRTICISFFDRITEKEMTHEYQCRQHLDVGLGGFITRIRHEELPGEREGLREFCAACGVNLDQATDKESS